VVSCLAALLVTGVVLPPVSPRAPASAGRADHPEAPRPIHDHEEVVV
jgi:hypothetical protein